MRRAKISYRKFTNYAFPMKAKLPGKPCRAYLHIKTLQIYVFIFQRLVSFKILLRLQWWKPMEWTIKMKVLTHRNWNLESRQCFKALSYIALAPSNLQMAWYDMVLITSFKADARLKTASRLKELAERQHTFLLMGENSRSGNYFRRLDSRLMVRPFSGTLGWLTVPL